MPIFQIRSAWLLTVLKNQKYNFYSIKSKVLVLAYKNKYFHSKSFVLLNDTNALTEKEIDKSIFLLKRQLIKENKPAKCY